MLRGTIRDHVTHQRRPLLALLRLRGGPVARIAGRAAARRGGVGRGTVLDRRGDRRRLVISPSPPHSPDTIRLMDEMGNMAGNPAHKRNFEKLLYLACQRGDPDRVAERLSWGVDPNCTFAKGRTPLIANVGGRCPRGDGSSPSEKRRRPARPGRNRPDGPGLRPPQAGSDSSPAAEAAAKIRLARRERPAVIEPRRASGNGPVARGVGRRRAGFFPPLVAGAVAGREAGVQRPGRGGEDRGDPGIGGGSGIKPGRERFQCHHENPP